MSKDRLVAVSEVEPPDLDVPVSWPRHQQCAVVGDVHTGDRELVSIQRQEKLYKVKVFQVNAQVTIVLNKFKQYKVHTVVMIIKIYLHQEKQYMYKVHVHVQVMTKKKFRQSYTKFILTKIKPKKTKLCTLYRDKQKEVFKRKSYSRRYINFIHYLLNNW